MGLISGCSPERLSRGGIRTFVVSACQSPNADSPTVYFCRGIL
jgi:hypothetical protein